VSDRPAGGEHLSLDALAELEEGIADAPETLRGHLDGCEACRRRAGTLRASRALLSALPPDPMPSDVAARIDAALAAEPAPAALLAPGGNIVPLRGRSGWWRGPNIAAVAAGVAVLALVGALLAGHTGGGSPSTAADKAQHPAAGAVAAPSPRLKQFETGANYTPTTERGLVTALILSNPPPLPSQPTASSSLAGAAGPKPSQPATQPAVGAGAAPSYDRAALRQPANVYACAALLADHPVQPIAVDYARYNGAPAVILVLPNDSHPDTLDVYVIPTACSEAAGDTQFFRMARPH
jgi:hypothetical protein